MLLRLAYLGVTNAFALLRLLPRTDRDKDAEILALRHQLAVLQRQLSGRRSGSSQPIEGCLLRYCIGSRDHDCTVYTCWYAPTRSCVGIATCLLAATRRCPGHTGPAGREPYARCALWCCAW